MTQRMKKILVLVLAVALIVGVVFWTKSCEKKEQEENSKESVITVIKLYNLILEMGEKNKISYLSGERISEDADHLEALAQIEKWYETIWGEKICIEDMTVEQRCNQLIASWQLMYDYHHNDGKSILDFIKVIPNPTSIPEQTTEPTKKTQKTDTPKVTTTPKVTSTPKVTTTPNVPEPTPPIPDEPIGVCNEGDGEGIPGNTEPPVNNGGSNGGESTPGNTEPPIVEATPGNTEPPHN